MTCLATQGRKGTRWQHHNSPSWVGHHDSPSKDNIRNWDLHLFSLLCLFCLTYNCFHLRFKHHTQKISWWSQHNLPLIVPHMVGGEGVHNPGPFCIFISQIKTCVPPVCSHLRQMIGWENRDTATHRQKHTGLDFLCTADDVICLLISSQSILKEETCTPQHCRPLRSWISMQDTGWGNGWTRCNVQGDCAHDIHSLKRMNHAMEPTWHRH